MIFIIDASSIIAFYAENELNQPNLLHELAKKGHKLMIPVAVFNEIKKGRKPTLSILLKAIQADIIDVKDVSPEETNSFGKRYPRLHDGEIQVLLLGLNYKKRTASYFCVVDEGPARKVADKLRILVKGTKGLLTLLNQFGIIDLEQKEKLLNRLDNCNFRA